MKELHTSILEVLSKYFEWNTAVELTEEVLDGEFVNLECTEFDIFDHICLNYNEEKSWKIAKECIDSFKEATMYAF